MARNAVAEYKKLITPNNSSSPPINLSEENPSSIKPEQPPMEHATIES